MSKIEQLYEELVATHNHVRVSDMLIDMVISACDNVAEQVNSQSALEQIRWLIDNGYSAEDIRKFVERKR